jgi:hypothetical protein
MLTNLHRSPTVLSGFSNLIQALDGSFYVLTSGGTMLRLDDRGTLTTRYTLRNTLLVGRFSALIQASD